MHFESLGTGTTPASKFRARRCILLFYCPSALMSKHPLMSRWGCFGKLAATGHLHTNQPRRLQFRVSLAAPESYTTQLMPPGAGGPRHLRCPRDLSAPIPPVNSKRPRENIFHTPHGTRKQLQQLVFFLFPFSPYRKISFLNFNIYGRIVPVD